MSNPNNTKLRATESDLYIHFRKQRPLKRNSFKRGRKAPKTFQEAFPKLTTDSDTVRIFLGVRYCRGS